MSDFIGKLLGDCMDGFTSGMDRLVEDGQRFRDEQRRDRDSDGIRELVDRARDAALHSSTRPSSDTKGDMTVAEVAERMRVSGHTVLVWIKNGSLSASNAARTPGARKLRWRVSEAGLAEFLNRRAVGSGQPAAVSWKRKRRDDDGLIEFY